MNVLFICTYNQWRSLTAEKLFANREGVTVQSAGIASTARVRVSEKLLNWAELIFVMEPRHQEYIAEVFPSAMKDKEIICLDISSGYRFNDPELIQLLEEGTKEYF
jgi:protein-tyrosine phosphatase